MLLIPKSVWASSDHWFFEYAVFRKYFFLPVLSLKRLKKEKYTIFIFLKTQAKNDWHLLTTLQKGSH